MRRLLAYRNLIMLAFTVWCITVDSLAQTRDGNFWIPNNTVKSIIADDSRGIILLGGGFDYIGPYTGGSIMLNKTTAVYDQTFPVIDGTVNAAVSDGSGGIFIGGNFTSVGGSSRNNLAHITSAGIVSSWNPNPNNSVYSLVLNDGVLYVGGPFTSIDGQTVSCLAAFDASTETYYSSFQPEMLFSSNSAYVGQLSVYGSKLYIAGDFNTIGDSSRNNLAAVDKITGAVDMWNPSPSHWTDPIYLNIYAITSYSGTLFIGGNFTTIGGQNRRSLAQVDTTTGTATSWDAQIDPYIYQNIFSTDTSSVVFALNVKGDTLYVGGSFQGFQGQTSYGLAALNASSSTIISGAVPSLLANTSAGTFSLDGTTLYIGGGYSSIGGQTRKNLSAINVETGSLLSWNPMLSYDPTVIVSSGTQVYVGGQFYSANGVVRNGIAAIDQSTGVPTSWNPNTMTTDNETSVNAMALVDTVLYVGGRFNSFGSQSRTSLAAVGITGGGLLSFNHMFSKSSIFGSTQPEIFAMTYNANKLYVGGSIDTIDGNRRYGAAAFELSDGSLSSWNPNPTNSVEAGNIEALAVSGNKVYLGGASFDMVGDSSRTNIAAVDTGSAQVFSWNPGADSHVYSFAVDGSTLYVGGSFNQIGGQTRNHLAVFDTSSSTPTSWNSDLNSSVDAITVNASNVYIGGFLQSVGGTTRYSAAAVDKTTGALSSWNPQIDAGNFVEAIAVSPLYQKVYIGGGFNTILGEYSENFGAVTNPFDSSLPVELISFTASAKQNGIELSWATATELNNYGFEVERTLSQTLPLQGGRQGGGWSKLGFVEGSGTTNVSKQYSFTDKNLSAGTYSYRLKQIDRDGSFKYSPTVEVGIGITPTVFALGQNYPNPFNPTTVISYQLPVNGHVTLKVYDAIGREVATLVNEVKEAGSYSATFSAAGDTEIASGVYFYRLQAGNFTITKKLMLVK